MTPCAESKNGRGGKMATSLAKSAQWYAKFMGWEVLPLKPSSKEPWIKRKDGGNGVYDATTDIIRIREWWGRNPDLNVGLHASRFWVLDVDRKGSKDGFAALADLERAHGALDGGPMQLTGGEGEGVQLFFAYDERVRNRVNANKVPGLDVRAPGGYVVAPPSIHPDTGRAYRWAPGRSPLDVGLYRAPEWLIDAISKKPDFPPLRRSAPVAAYTQRRLNRYTRIALQGEIDNVLTAQKGTRNHTLFTASARLFELVAAGWINGEQVQAVLESAAYAIGLNPEEIKKTIASGKTHGLSNPRQVRER